jgi:hypothetical protein
MAPAYASPQSPDDRPDVGQRKGQSEHEQERQTERNRERQQPSRARERERNREREPEHDNVYGPLDIERHLKHDGRVLILYTRREREGL